MPWDFTASYAYDGADAKPYLTVNLNDTTTKDMVGRWGFKVSSISDSLHGLTVFETNEVSCIWDRVQLTLSDASGGTQNPVITLNATHEYDGASADISLKAYLEGLEVGSASGIGSVSIPLTANLTGSGYLTVNGVDNIWGIEGSIEIPYNIAISNLRTSDYSVTEGQDKEVACQWSNAATLGAFPLEIENTRMCVRLIRIAWFT